MNYYTPYSDQILEIMSARPVIIGNTTKIITPRSRVLENKLIQKDVFLHFQCTN